MVKERKKRGEGEEGGGRGGRGGGVGCGSGWALRRRHDGIVSVPVHDDEAHGAVAGALLRLLHRETLVDEHALAKQKGNKRSKLCKKRAKAKKDAAWRGKKFHRKFPARRYTVDEA